MGDISPVIASYLAGQAHQTDLLKTAQNVIAQQTEAKQRQQQLDDIMKRFQVTSKQEQDKLALEHEIFQLNHKKAMAEEGQRVLERLQSMPETAPGTFTAQAPGATMMVPGMDGKFVEQQGAPRQTTIGPTPGSQITVDTAYGPMTMNMPKSKTQEAVEQQQAMLPGVIKQYEATIGKSKERDYEAKIAGLQNKLEITDKVNAAKQALTETQGDYKAAIAAMNAQAAMEREFFKLNAGRLNPEVKTKVANNIAMGLDDLSHYTGKEKEDIMQEMNNLNLTAPQGGQKFTTELMQFASNFNRLYNDGKSLDSEFPASSTKLGKGIDYLRNNRFADLGQRFARYGDNLAAMAKLTGETPAMARAVAFANAAKSAQVAPEDSIATRHNKLLNQADLFLTNANAAIATIKDPNQRANYWKLILANAPGLKGDMKLAPVLTKLIHGLPYNAEDINALKMKENK